MTIEVVLLCGGRGERLRPQTDTCQKCMLPVGGRPFLDKVIEEYASHDLRSFVLLAGYLGHQVQEAYAEWGQWRGLNVSVITDYGNGPKIEHKGTLPALLNYCSTKGTTFLPDKFLLANGDTLIQTGTRPQNFSGNSLAFRINRVDCGLRMFNTDLIIDARQVLPATATSIEKDLFQVLPKLRWQNLDKESSRFIDIGTPENLERARVIFR